MSGWFFTGTAISPTAPSTTRRTGIVRPDGRAVQDDDGLFHPFGLSFFWAMQGWKHERERFKKNAEWAALKRFDYFRILTEVGWAGREIDPSSPAWSDWGTVLRELLDYLYRGCGLRAELTLIGKGTKTDPMWLTREVCTILGENRQHMVMNIECANEYTEAGGFPLDTMKRMARVLRADTSNIIALSSPGNWGDLMVSAREVGINGFTFHPDRGDGDHKWRQVRQLYDMKNAKPFVTFDNEPAGPASSVKTQTHPLQLAMTRAVGVMCGGAGYVFHTGTGVFGDGRAHQTAGARPPNFWEIDNIDALIEAVRGVGTLLPEGVENWTVANTQWSAPNPVAPFQPHHHWEGDEERDKDGLLNNGVNKAYAALAPDGRVIQMPCGVRDHVDLRASYPLHDVVVYDPISLQPKLGLPTSFNTNDVLTLPGGGQDAMVAYIIHGRR
jgi:hypothetical protein